MSSPPLRYPRPPTAPATRGPIQLVAAPDGCRIDFSPLRDEPPRETPIDLVSIADLLRNGFVYPPHSIFTDVKIAISGFESDQDLYAQPHFHFPYQSSNAPPRPTVAAADEPMLVERYHQLLCEAVARAGAGMRAPVLLQSGGKDSTSIAIALAEVRPDATCMTYLGGHEENEVESARHVARQLGLRHETLVCDPGRAYDRYLAMVPHMPLLTADFAMLSYADLVTEIAGSGSDGVLDAIGSDPYFGLPLRWPQLLRGALARRLRVPERVLHSSFVGRHFALSYALGSLQMDHFERTFPGSRFTDREVDELLCLPMAATSRRRIELFRADITAAPTLEARRRVAATIVEAATFGKGMYTTAAMGLQLGYPYCDASLREWIFRQVPNHLLIGRGGVNKVLVRRHIARQFRKLPYVRIKGSFRFDVCGLAERFDQVHDFARQAQSLMPGATRWLERYRHQLGNKYFASKFYLLAVTLPWLLSRIGATDPSARDC
ncbi:MAG TPA: asparagine synthase-related protein [Dyella sp.]|nr:asparagine synthase-related protein [Dyella sp.]